MSGDIKAVRKISKCRGCLLCPRPKAGTAEEMICKEIRLLRRVVKNKSKEADENERRALVWGSLAIGAFAGALGMFAYLKVTAPPEFYRARGSIGGSNLFLTIEPK